MYRFTRCIHRYTAINIIIVFFFNRGHHWLQYSVYTRQLVLVFCGILNLIFDIRPYYSSSQSFYLLFVVRLLHVVSLSSTTLADTRLRTAHLGYVHVNIALFYIRRVTLCRRQ